ncbi:1,4-alpha-glucan branching enzyme GlgB OS=Tsukamurella paurometabola (strain ATCC 8368 / DSM/ CCUG 35730 / CIP 100753 / JCM 10117 / KCTC 9821 / NBRC 16120/ NCIMB 702349 / NCTC 13040) OX=521096 GN=glgB PE=3 SV=1 [Tsukamurella paurometabola]|uniref:1,4-alpha-glucan branching enzyme GlgB n=1 Tax=Tsukamurella paurometabola (strain ATCC 8368 / DSM 20162 / CCUG 35730 / CIP 100753 / JCM 10117 / KCTC 9821 / NBRC 16120 / NCIMB 702349 / NCTC 13040) TaxID=521096 RepID=D5UWN6_TSUPD|nr:1,4-alpha-glucan branching protein GlgB [Tsukamurella paurometabola]ADG77908.1 1,4-alpha-glucan branching enzyme [Tsukamurella paurometabola DSM 20162]SUP29308.1 1,4-alpha-glucan branching enzyme GlgB [Tsukamurella paurometabola]
MTDDPAQQNSPAASVDPEARARLLTGRYHDPHAILGAHPTARGTVLRALKPGATAVSAVIGGERYPLARIDGALWGTEVPITDLVDYRYEVLYPAGTMTVADGYRFLPTVGEMDQHLISEGRHERLWDVLGAHLRSYTTPDGEVTGTSFAVWAPNANGVTVIGDFEYWAGESYPMRTLGSSGVWEVFVPGVADGAAYKFRIFTDNGPVEKADPMARRTEVPPATASIVTHSTHEWRDASWMAERAKRSPTDRPMSTYEVHLGSWRQGLSYLDLATELADYVTETGFTHVELLPVAEHPFGGSWGYQVTSYYAPTSRFGTPDEFREFVDVLHRRGIGVIVDWVPAHFPKDAWALARFDGTPLYEHGDPQRGEQLDWGTYVFDFGRREVRNFLVANALYWFDEFHVDGLRVDAVASMLYLDYSRPDGGWTPNVYGGRENLEAVEFLQEMNATVHKLFPGVVTVAEESTSWPGVTRRTDLGGLGFTMKWNMGWMHDTLGYLGRDQVHRSFHHHEVTFSLMYAWSENFVLPISHDEVVHGKGTLWTRMPGDAHTKAAGVRALLAYMWGHPGKQLLFMGQEFGQVREWSEERSLDWDCMDGWEGELHSGIRSLTRDLNAAYRSHPALWSQDTTPSGYEWVDANDSQNNVLSFLRWGSDGSVVLCLYNFSGQTHERYRVGVPFPGSWREILNTDSAEYSGSGAGNMGGVSAESRSWHGRPASTEVVLGPNSAVWLTFDGA